jgi:hypothetical protein
MRKETIVTLAIVGATTFLLVFSNSASAFWPFDSKDESGTETTFSPLIQRLVEKFNLNQDEVKVVMDEAREEHHSQMEENFENNLNMAVENGTLTQEQKQLIEAKHDEMEAKHEELRGVRGPEKREQMQATHEEMQTWAEENGIDLSELMPMGAFGSGKGMGEGRRGIGDGMHRNWKTTSE